MNARARAEAGCRRRGTVVLPALVIAGNIVGGSVFVALVSWLIYLRPSEGRDGD